MLKSTFHHLFQYFSEAERWPPPWCVLLGEYFVPLTPQTKLWNPWAVVLAMTMAGLGRDSSVITLTWHFWEKTPSSVSRKYRSVIAHPCYKKIQIRQQRNGKEPSAVPLARQRLKFRESTYTHVDTKVSMLRRTEQEGERSPPAYPGTGGLGINWDVGDRHWDPSSLATRAESDLTVLHTHMAKDVLSLSLIFWTILV